MIPQNTVDRIIATADVVDVVKDFVSLSKRGVNFLGLCPFHNEKTPSFSVSPSKGIYKCFGCGKGGNAVNFIMEHEQLSYVEALKYLAKKYNIEVEERELTPEEREQHTLRDSLMVVTAWAQRYFSDNLTKYSEGKNVGQSYLRERGIRPDVIEKFQLGYGLEERTALTQEALRGGYKQEFLVKSGLSIGRDDGTAFDRFNGRVIFPIHSISGRVIGFGGRILRNDAKTAKYLNSPESEIYHKSSILYGIYFAKKTITQLDKCYLVEGYTDVIAFHQAGIENVVASSGTALTPDQIRLIKRFTQNVTVIFDGDAAGIKASLRGIDLILEEGLNVKVVPLPQGEDPDGFARSQSASQLAEYIAKHEVDFINFKANLLLDEAKNDPIQRANLIRDIVRSVAVIPESITRSVYIRECTRILDVDEALLYSEVAKQRRARMEKILGKDLQPLPITNPPSAKQTPSLPGFIDNVFCEEQEKEILYFLLKHGAEVFFEISSEDELEPATTVTVGQHIISEILSDDLEFKNLAYKKVFDEYRKMLEEGEAFDNRHFINHADPDISRLAVDLLTTQHKLSKIWAKHKAMPLEEGDFLHSAVPKAIMVYKTKITQLAILDLQAQLKEAHQQDDTQKLTELLQRLKAINSLKTQLSKEIERIIP